MVTSQTLSLPTLTRRLVHRSQTSSVMTLLRIRRAKRYHPIFSLLLSLLLGGAFHTTTTNNNNNYYYRHLVIAFDMKTIQYRTATQSDVSVARKILFQEKMNPLSISTKHLIVAFLDNDVNNRKDNNNNNNKVIIGFGQIRPIDNSEKVPCTSYELASLFVDPEYRRKGIATCIIKQLLQRHDNNNNNNNNNQEQQSKIYLLTLRPTSPLYAKQGFIELQDRTKLPKSLQLELIAGSILSAILGNDLICMVRTS